VFIEYEDERRYFSIILYDISPFFEKSEFYFKNKDLSKPVYVKTNKRKLKF